MTYKKKLIEVALPLDAINKASAREKSIRQGHPSTLHLWWARRPLAAARAVLWSSLVDDPSSHPDRFPTEEAQEAERQRLFRILEELVVWENSNSERVLAAARAEIVASCDGDLPNILDPFCGGGTIPLEAQRLGLPAYGSDLNPVAVLITKALVEVPPVFGGLPPVCPSTGNMGDELRSWKGAEGLAADVRFYGSWLREEAESRIGHLYPCARLPESEGGGEAPVIAWLWTRTVVCSDPACGKATPLLSSFVVASKKGKERYISPESVDGSTVYRITDRPPTRWPNPKKGLKRGMSGTFECLHCGTVTTRSHVADQAQRQQLGLEPTAVVVAGQGRRIYLDATASPMPVVLPEVDTTDLDMALAPNPRDVWCRNFGLERPVDLFTPRQLVGMTVLSDLVDEARAKVHDEAVGRGFDDDGERLVAGGSGATAYADAVATYLALVVSRLSDYSASTTTWASNAQMEILRSTFARQAIPMTWDFAEGNIFGSSSGSVTRLVESVAKVIERLPAEGSATIKQLDASQAMIGVSFPMVATDPPYYDNIGYADLSDFFYVWLRRALRRVYPDLFSTLLTPKTEELVAASYRFSGDKKKAERHFESGLGSVFERIHAAQNSNYPMTLFYAFKQAETGAEGVASTGWESMLEGLLRAGYTVTATWPVRTERSGRTVAIGTAALASSIVLACRPQSDTAALGTRSEYVESLRSTLPRAVDLLQRESVAPVDLAQSAIGPGMAVFSGYSKVIEADGSVMTVRQALVLINEVLQEVLSEEETEFDGDTRWALTWFDQYGLNPGPFGDAEMLSKAKGTSVSGVIQAGVASRLGGRVRLLDRAEMSDSWDPASDTRLTVWEVTQHLISGLDESEITAANLLRRVGPGMGERARLLAYLLFQIADRRGWASEAVAYNGLVQTWPNLTRLAAGPAGPTQQTLGE